MIARRRQLPLVLGAERSPEPVNVKSGRLVIHKAEASRRITGPTAPARPPELVTRELAGFKAGEECFADSQRRALYSAAMEFPWPNRHRQGMPVSVLEVCVNGRDAAGKPVGTLGVSYYVLLCARAHGFVEVNHYVASSMLLGKVSPGYAARAHRVASAISTAYKMGGSLGTIMALVKSRWQSGFELNLDDLCLYLCQWQLLGIDVSGCETQEDRVGLIWPAFS